MAKYYNKINSHKLKVTKKYKTKVVKGNCPRKIFQISWEGYRISPKRKFMITPYHEEIVAKLMKCQESGKKGLGYHKYQCPNHPEEVRIVPHTCKTKICTTCATLQSEQWSEDMKERFPDEEYLHVTLTMPEEFRPFFGEEDDEKWSRKNELYNLGWETIRGYLLNKSILGGCLTILHTFGRALNLNPHLHIILPAGGISKVKDETSHHPNHEKYVWKKLHHIPRAYVSQVWKNNLLEYILDNTQELKPYKEEIFKLRKHDNYENHTRIVKILKQACPYKGFENMDQALEWENKWLKVIQINYYVNIKKKRKYQQTVCYIARYARRLPIAKSRIIDWDPKTEMMTWRYEPHGDDKPVDTTMHVYRFFDLILQHIPPKHFRAVRYYGIFATKNISKYHKILEQVSSFIKPQPKKNWAERLLEFEGEYPLICHFCQQHLILVEKSHITASGDFKTQIVQKI